MTQRGGTVEHINPDGPLSSAAFGQVVMVTGPVRTVAGLAVPDALVEIEATAVVPLPAQS